MNSTTPERAVEIAAKLTEAQRLLVLRMGHARSVYRDQYRQSRRKTHGGGNSPVDYAKFAARCGFYILYGQRVGMPFERVFKGLDTECWDHLKGQP